MTSTGFRPVIGNNVSDTLSSSIALGASSIPVNAISKWGTGIGKVIVDRGTSKEEVFLGTGISGSSITVDTNATTYKEGTSQIGHDAGATIESVPTAGDQNDLYNGLLVEHNATGTHKSALVTTLKATAAEVTTGTDDTKIVTPKGLKDAGILTTTQYAPEGFLINGKIVPSVTSNNLTVALKGMDGNDPSASNPIYVRIGDTVRSITSALSITRNAGTNWAYAGSAEMATKEIDWFVYLHYYPDTTTIYLFLSRICHPRNFVGFPNFNSTTDSKTALHSGAVANATDDVCVIGRFGATLSAGAGYTWSVPTFTATNLIQRPIYETRFLSYVPTLTWSAGVAPSGSPGINTHTYKITYNNMHVSNFVDGYSAGTSVTRVQITTPILPSGYFVNSGQITVSDTPNATTGYVASGGIMNLFCTSVAATRFTNVALFSI